MRLAVVLGAADIGMFRAGQGQLDGRELGLVKPVMENGLDALVRGRTNGQSTNAGGFATERTHPFGEADDADTGTEALLGMGTPVHDLLDHP